MNWTIIEVSKQTGISPHTLRFWARKGVFEIVIDRDENGVKYFNQQAIEWVMWVNYLRNAGMSLKDIKKYATLLTQGIISVQERKEMLVKQAQALKKQLLIINESMKMLEKKIGIYDEMIARGVDLFNPLNTQDYNCKEK
ncbi:MULTISPECIES: MerR family transcriptional regulator [Helicobacter]|uniref:MerR family transcriptional regulator n=1 Tax=Helicobacter TaxID=209 RepID=UPI002FDFCDC0